MASITQPLRELAQSPGNPTGKAASLILVEASMEQLQPRATDPVVTIHGLPDGHVEPLDIQAAETSSDFRKRLGL